MELVELMGKGDHRRPADVDAETLARNWEKAFGKRQKQAKQVLNDALQEVFSHGGIESLEPLPGAEEGNTEAGDSGYEGSSPHVEGS